MARCSGPKRKAGRRSHLGVGARATKYPLWSRHLVFIQSTGTSRIDGYRKAFAVCETRHNYGELGFVEARRQALAIDRRYWGRKRTGLCADHSPWLGNGRSGRNRQKEERVL